MSAGESRSEPELIALDNGVIVERDTLGVIMEINQKWPGQFRVQYLDPDMIVGVTEAPYQIVEQSQRGEHRDHIVLQVWSLDSSVIKKLEAMDTNYVDIEAVIEETNRKAARRERREYEDRMQDAHEKAAAVIKSNKDSYRLEDEGVDITIRTSGDHDVRRN